jgi:acetolactate synthase I/II/III large subunit
MATIAQLGLNIPTVVINNGGFAILRARQMSNYKRSIGADLVNPDFRAFAASFGFHGKRIERLEDLGPQLQEALHSDRTTLIEVPIEFSDYRGGAIE